ncbi:unnamed protein product [Chironomus riparius]|uniref:VWFA domain-containing protein n=1 Tax=Chironomus riparius TaxID=315576 RepID=A0A9N9S9P4_9DIPT|nr:unnamed protein product [Chironomus riparius]
MSEPTVNQPTTMGTTIDSPYEIKLYPIEDDFIACLDTTNILDSAQKIHSKVETVVIIDRSGSMGRSVYKIVHSVLPKFFEYLSYDPETLVNVIAFESKTVVHKVKVGDFKDFKMFSAGGTSMAPAVTELHTLFEEFKSTVTSLRIITISDGEVFDQYETKELGDKLAEFAGKCNISVNSQAVRFFTSRAQPDTTALCSLLQLNNVDKCQMIDVGAQKHHDKIAREMADLFINDGFDHSKILQSNETIFYKFPWDEEALDQILILPGRRNVFWVDEVPKDSQMIKVEGKPVKVSIQKDISLDTFQLLLSAKLDFVIDRMKILKIVNSDSAKITIEKMVEYFSRIEKMLVSLVGDEVVDPKSIANRARLVKLNRIRSRKITTFLETIANDDHVHKLNAMQKANYLRSVQASSKAGRGLAKRAAKKKNKIRAKVLSFDEIVHQEVKAIKANFHEIKDIDHKKHSVSFYSQATTLEGIKSLIEFTDDVTFPNFTAEEILQVLNLVGVACNCPVGDFPDASTWRVNEIYYGCYVSVADIITSIHQSKDTEFVLKAPGIDKEIMNVIPVFDDPRIGVFLKKYAPSILEFTSSIGMRRVIADVPMTFGYNIIAGIRRMIYDLNKNKSTLHLETFKQLISTAASFVGKYHDHIEELLKDKEHGMNGYYLGNNGIASLLVPLIRIYSKKNHEAVKRIPDILRSIYSYEIWKGISKEYKGKQNFDQIVKDMLLKLLGIDLETQKIKITPKFESEPKREDIQFPDEFKIDQDYLDKLTQPLYYHNYMTLLPQLLTAATHGQLEDIKSIPEMTKATALEAFGIDYSHKEFVFLNVFQSLRYPRTVVRADTKAQTMKILDVKYHQTAMEDVKKYVREQFEAQYEFDVKMKRRQEELEMAQTIVDSLINEANYRAMANLWKNGITKNNITYKIANSCSNGFKLLCRKLVDLKVEIPLRSKIIEILLLGVDADGQVVYNNGEVCDIKNIKKYKRRFLLTGTIEEWNEVEQKYNSRNIHAYREKENRRGHGNSKPSYWAIGFNHLIDLLRPLTDEERDDYVSNHERCCDANNVRWALWNERWENERKERELLIGNQSPESNVSDEGTDDDDEEQENEKEVMTEVEKKIEQKDEKIEV